MLNVMFDNNHILISGKNVGLLFSWITEPYLMFLLISQHNLIFNLNLDIFLNEFVPIILLFIRCIQILKRYGLIRYNFIVLLSLESLFRPTVHFLILSFSRRPRHQNLKKLFNNVHFLCL